MRFINLEDERCVKDIMRNVLLDLKDEFGNVKDKGISLSVYFNAILEDLDAWINGYRNFDFISWDKKKKPTKAKLVLHNGDTRKNRILEMLISNFIEEIR